MIKLFALKIYSPVQRIIDVIEKKHNQKLMMAYALKLKSSK